MPIGMEDYVPPTDDQILREAVDDFNNSSLVEDFSAASKSADPQFNVADFQVVTLEDAGLKMVVPAGAEIPTVTVDGRIQLPEPAGANTSGAAPTATYNEIVWDAPTCFAISHTTGAKAGTNMRWCEQWGNAIFKPNITGKRYPIHTLDLVCSKNPSAPNQEIVECKVESVPIPGMPAVEWIDYKPNVSSSGACRDVSLGITILGLSAQGSFPACEKVLVDIGTAPAYAARWRPSTNFFGAVQFIPDDEGRSIAYMLGWSLPATETWWFPNRYVSIEVFNSTCFLYPNLC